jgi:hypothetical protein
MTHFTDQEFVDLLDGALPAARARHADGCPSCAERLDLMRDAVARASDVDVPEPSPLFWEHFSARVRESVGQSEPASSSTSPSPSSWAAESFSRAGVMWALAGTVAMALVAAVLWRGPSHPSDSPRSETMASSAGSTPVPGRDEIADLDTLANGIEQDEAWALVRTVADDISWDDQTSAGMGARPGSAERATLALTAAERSELMELLAEETRRSGA